MSTGIVRKHRDSKGATTPHVLRTHPQRGAPAGQSLNASTERNEMNPRTTSGPDNVRGPADECKKPAADDAPIRLTLAERYGADGALTPLGETQFTRENILKLTALFQAGDVVFEEEKPGVFGIVTETAGLASRIVWQHGGGAAGPGLWPSIWHREPRINVPVPNGALGNRGWNREQAVTAALRKAGVL